MSTDCQYTRTVYSFFDMLGFLGGIFGLAHPVAFILVQFVANRQFYSFVISKVYANKEWNQNSIQHLIEASENSENLEQINCNITPAMQRSKKSYANS